MSSLPSSSSSSSSRQKYDVFLSFRGEDTRKNFTDHLYAALKKNGIKTFRDDPRLEAGEEIAPELLKAIQESWCSLIVFSKTYAFSSWCLDELAEIVEQREKRRHKIFPIFYDVDPSDLRKQTGRVAEAFSKHEERYKGTKDKIQRWRTALTEVANIKGWHLNNRHESEFIGDIVKKISAKLFHTYPIVHDEFIGINSRLEELHLKIDVGEDDIRIIGICGMGGIGKTTLAREVYFQMSPHFEGKSFLADVREVSEKCGLVSLQKQLLFQILSEEGFNLFSVHEGNAMISCRLSHKKVLVVIDDVDNFKHLECLVGRRDWFGLGSRIIVTTRDEHLLQSYGMDDVYKPPTLVDDEALHLLKLKAFKSDTVPENDFIELSKQVVAYAGGLPLALEVIGCFLCGRDAAQWRSAIERLKRDFHKEIHDRLLISFDGLEETEKDIFLDIACFFKGGEKDFVTNILDGCGFFAEIGINRLIEKSLIKVTPDKFLWMHDLLQQMGRKIVRQKSVDEPGKRCRLWEENDVYHVLTKNTATDAIEGMIIDNKGEQNNMFTLNADAFLNMKKLRLLKAFCLPVTQDLKYLSNELRLLDWSGYPFRSLPSSFQPDNLVALLLPYSHIEQLWKGDRTLPKLKLVDLRGSKNLIKTLDFTRARYLESLILEGCSKIVELPSSIGHLSNLVLLNLKDCSNLVNLPSSINGLKCLKTLNLSGCSKVETLPENLQHVEFLEELDLSKTAIRKPPSFIFQFKSLKVLSFNGCKGPPSKVRLNLPSLFNVLLRRSSDSMALMLPSLSGLSSIKNLNLSDCNLGEGAIPIDIGCLSSLESLDLSGNHFVYLPATLNRLSKLSLLELSDCRELKSLPELLLKYTYPSVNGNLKQIGRIIGFNCYKLAKKNNTLTMLKNHLKVSTKAGRLFDIFIPGSEIPEWFCHRRDESSIKIPLPLNIGHDNQLMGVAFCCVFVLASTDDDVRWKTFCKAVIHGRNIRDLNDSFYCFDREDRLPLDMEHLWLRYYSRDMIFPLLSSSSTDWANQECNEIEFSTRAIPGQVKKCGVQIMYEKDLEVMEELQEQHNSPTNSADLDDIH